MTTGISIFIDSRMQISSPSATICPSSTTTCHTFAVISARISAMARRSSRSASARPLRSDAAATPCLRQGRSTCLSRGDAAGRCQIACAGLGGVDHVVELRVPGGDVRVDVLRGSPRPARAASASRSSSGTASSVLRWMMLTMPSGPITAISAVGHATM